MLIPVCGFNYLFRWNAWQGEALMKSVRGWLRERPPGVSARQFGAYVIGPTSVL
jgi:hypothetical protein